MIIFNLEIPSLLRLCARKEAKIIYERLILNPEIWSLLKIHDINIQENNECNDIIYNNPIYEMYYSNQNLSINISLIPNTNAWRAFFLNKENIKRYCLDNIPITLWNEIANTLPIPSIFIETCSNCGKDDLTYLMYFYLLLYKNKKSKWTLKKLVPISHLRFFKIKKLEQNYTIKILCNNCFENCSFLNTQFNISPF